MVSLSVVVSPCQMQWSCWHTLVLFPLVNGCLSRWGELDWWVASGQRVSDTVSSASAPEERGRAIEVVAGRDRGKPAGQWGVSDLRVDWRARGFNLFMRSIFISNSVLFVPLLFQLLAIKTSTNQFQFGFAQLLAIISYQRERERERWQKLIIYSIYSEKIQNIADWLLN